MKPEQPQIRPYQASDEPSVVALLSQVLPSSAPHNNPSTSIRKKLLAGDGLLLVAEVNGQLAGTAMGGYDGHRGWIYSVAVLPQYRRQGVGSSLIHALEQLLTKLGCLKINLQVVASNAAVVEFYKKLGFEIEERLSMGKKLY